MAYTINITEVSNTVTATVIEFPVTVTPADGISFTVTNVIQNFSATSILNTFTVYQNAVELKIDDFDNIFKGDWVSGTTYLRGDLVNYAYSLYVTHINTLSTLVSVVTPAVDTTNWRRVVWHEAPFDHITVTNASRLIGPVTMETPLALLTVTNTTRLIGPVIMETPLAILTVTNTATVGSLIVGDIDSTGYQFAVRGNARVGGNLLVNGNTHIIGDAEIDGTLIPNGNVTFNGLTTFNNTATFNRPIFVNNTATFTKPSFFNDLITGGDMQLTDGLTIGSNVHYGGLVVNGTSSFYYGDLYVGDGKIYVGTEPLQDPATYGLPAGSPGFPTKTHYELEVRGKDNNPPGPSRSSDDALLGHAWVNDTLEVGADFTVGQDVTINGGRVDAPRLGAIFAPNSVNYIRGLVVDNLAYPTTRGYDGQILATDGIGNARWVNPQTVVSISDYGTITGGPPQPGPERLVGPRAYISSPYDIFWYARNNTVYIDLTSPSSDFTQGDIQIESGTIYSFTKLSSTQYELIIRPAAPYYPPTDRVIIRIPANTFHDEFGRANPYLASQAFDYR